MHVQAAHTAQVNQHCDRQQVRLAGFVGVSVAGVLQRVSRLSLLSDVGVLCIARTVGSQGGECCPVALTLTAPVPFAVVCVAGSPTPTA